MRLVSVLLGLLLTHGVQLPPRDASQAAPPTGSGVIRGRVLAADTKTPIRRALVTISGGPQGRGPAQTIYSDGQGRYEFRGLAAGSYLVSAGPNQFQAQFMTPPRPLTTSPDDSRRIEIAAGQTIDGHDVLLPRTGAIVGRLVDDHGDPVAGIWVNATRAGERSASTSGLWQPSDEFGRYRLFRLTPGTYQIVARPSGISGDMLTSGPNFGFIETYYPGTPSRDQAQLVEVRSGEETAAADFPIARGRLLTVSGTVVGSGGVPPAARVSVSFNTERGGVSTSADPQGRFSFRWQPPGNYRFVAKVASDSSEGGPLAYASVPVTLVDADIDDLVVTLKPTVTVSGRVVFDVAVPPAVSRELLTIRGEWIDRKMELSQPSAMVSPDLTFTLARLVGQLVLRPSVRLPGGWVLKAVMLGERDITDVATEFRPEDSSQLRIVLTNRSSELSGAVTGEKGEPAANTNVVLFSEDKSEWFGQSSRFRWAFPGRDGKFSIKGLRPGRYCLVALPPGRRVTEDTADAATLAALVPDATHLVLGEDEHRIVDLRVIKP